MKKIKLTSLLLFILLTSFGQPYHPLIRSNLVWDVMHGNGSQTCFLSGGNRYFFQGDTILNGILYQVIRGYNIVQLNSGPYCPPFAVDGSASFNSGAYIREDTVAEKVFVYDAGSNSDVLLYDFSLSDGDSLNSVYAGYGFQVIIDSVSTITLLNGTVRNIFYLNNNEYYIESVGGSQGLQFPVMQAIGFWEDPVCMTDNNVQLWGNQCVGFVNINEPEAHSIQVIPNTSQNNIKILLGHDEGARFSLFDLTGRIVLEETLVNSEIIDISKLPPGIYVYHLTNRQKIIIGKCFVAH